MKTALIILLAIAASQLNAQYNYKNLEAPAASYNNDQLKLYTYQNLRIYPVYAKESFINANKNIGKYTPLKEALEKQKVTITETSASGSRDNSPTVNTLYIQNLSNDTVYIMGGEVVKGGKQDRVVAQDVILPPKSKKTNLDVFCVEQGRWTYNSGDNFNTTVGSTSNSIRKAAAVEQNQSKVWEEVADVTSKNKATTNTGTYTSLEKSKEYSAKLSSYVSYFKTQLNKEKNVIGLIAASSDKVIGCDMFATTTMFNQQEDNLLRSYATESITNGAAVSVSNEKVKEYLDKILLSETARPAAINKNGKEFKKEDKVMHISTY